MVLNPFSLARHRPKQSVSSSVEMQSKIGAVSGMISMMGVGVGEGTPDWSIPPLPLIFFFYQLTNAFSVHVFPISRVTLTGRSFGKQRINHTGRVSSTFDILWAALGVCHKEKKRKQVNILPKSIDANISPLSFVLIFNL